ncbi:hypothetical protein [Roseibium sp.]|uniref:hypothetical protein n=1 Tax=Roseibium sp. TaxID=1936156 RepID=UPI003D0A24CB
MRTFLEFSRNCLTGFTLGTIAAVGLSSAHETSAGDGFRNIRVAPGLAGSTDFIEVLLPFLRNHPETDEGNAELDLKIRKDGNGYRVDLRKTGYLDDSVRGEVYRGTVIRTSEGTWQLLAMEVKPLCSRGENVGGVCTVRKPPPAMFLTPEAAPKDE